MFPVLVCLLVCLVLVAFITILVDVKNIFNISLLPLIRKSSMLYHNKIWLDLQLEKYEQVIQGCDYVLSSFAPLRAGNRCQIYVYRGIAHSRLKQYKEALEDYMQALKDYKGETAIYANRGYVYGQLKEYERAVEDYSRALPVSSKKRAIWLNRASAYVQLAQYEQAIEDYTHVIEIDQRNATLYVSRGIAYARIKQFELAIADYSRALQLNPALKKPYLLRAAAYYQQEKMQEALWDVERTLSFNPEDVQGHILRGSCYVCMRDYQRAWLDFDLAVALDPNNAYTYHNRGYISLALDKREQALADFYKSQELKPASIFHTWMWTWCKICTGELDFALTDRLVELVKLETDPGSTYTDHLCHGGVLWLREDYEQARIVLEQASILEPYHNEEASFWLGMAYASLGLDKKAVEVFHKAHTLGLPRFLWMPIYLLATVAPEFYKNYAQALLPEPD